MAGYRDAMATWKADEHELNEKRQSVSTRLNEIRQQATDEMARGSVRPRQKRRRPMPRLSRGATPMARRPLTLMLKKPPKPSRR